MPPKFQVHAEDLTTTTGIETIRSAVEMYINAFGKQFTGKHGVSRKTLYLHRFVAYLVDQGHSMKLADLTAEDGHNFFASLNHAYNSAPMSPQTEKRYKCALRSLGRFLS